MRARNRFFTLLSGALLLIGAAGAQTGQPAVLAVPAVAPAVPAPSATLAPPGTQQRYRGTIAEFDGPFLTLKTTERKLVTLGMTTATRLVHNRLLKLTDLQPGAILMVAALKGADGKFRAQGIRVYPATLRGQNEGAWPVDPANPTRLVIGGALTAVTPGGVGGTLVVAFHGAEPPGSPACDGHAAPGGTGCNGAAEIQFARGVPILAIEAGDTSQLLPGATISAAAAADAGGTLVATGVTVERDAPAPKPPKP
ncbi:MAG: hypothetical protein WDM91_08330 [Rhizomicrobium sp.]